MDKQCSCKGIRTCLQCENSKNIKPTFNIDNFKNSSYLYCPQCNLGYEGWRWDPENKDLDTWHMSHLSKDSATENHVIHVKGIFVQDCFVTLDEEKYLMDQIDRLPWINSQSGRRKQDFGPKVNFKRRKMKIGNFSGFPDFVQFLIRRFSDVRLLEGFQAVELCHLQYDPKRGSTIDPHMDDSWLWGERLVTVNIGSTVIFTLIQNSVALRIRLQPRSLLILYGEARYLWEHAIFREDVTDLRIALTFRELSKEFLKDGPQSEIGQQLLDVATKVIDTSLH